MRLVEPADPAPEVPGQAVAAALVAAGVPAESLPVLVRVFEALERHGVSRANEGLEDSLEARVVRFVGPCRRTLLASSPADSAALLRLLLSLCADGAGSRAAQAWPRRRARLLLRLIEAWRGDAPAFDLTPAVLELRLPPDREEPRFLCAAARALTRRGLLRPGRALSADTIRACHGRQVSIPGDLADVGRCDTWLWLLGPAGLSALCEVVEREPDDGLGELLRGAQHVLALWSVMAYRAHVDGASPLWLRCAPHLARLTALLRTRLDAHADEVLVLDPFWWASLRVLGSRPELLPDDVRSEACGSARRALGKLRPLLREAHEPDAAARFTRGLLAYHDAVRVLVSVEGVWAPLKSLLLAFSALSVPAVAPDLRYWNEPYRAPPAPQPWSNLPAWIAELVHGYARLEEAQDRSLRRLREEFGSFLLERLRRRPEKPKPGEPEARPGDGLVEPRAAWRLCAVRALRELRVNPRGTAHLVLEHASKDDPDESVRRAAREAIPEVRAGVTLPPGSSPRRAILNAFWWLRQAHLLALGVEVDPQGAQRTRQKETRRTTEKEVSAARDD